MLFRHLEQVCFCLNVYLGSTESSLVAVNGHLFVILKVTGYFCN